MVFKNVCGAEEDIWTDEVTGEWRRLHNDELHDLYCSPNIIRASKSRKMRWVRHAARMDERRHAYRVLVQKLKRIQNHLKDLGVNGKSGS
jgi:hypothetical protein